MAEKEPEGVNAEMDETVVHAYGIVAENEPLTEFPPGIAQMPVRVFDADGLGCIHHFHDFALRSAFVAIDGQPEIRSLC